MYGGKGFPALSSYSMYMKNVSGRRIMTWWKMSFLCTLVLLVWRCISSQNSLTMRKESSRGLSSLPACQYSELWPQTDVNIVMITLSYPTFLYTITVDNKSIIYEESWFKALNFILSAELTKTQLDLKVILCRGYKKIAPDDVIRDISYWEWDNSTTASMRHKLWMWNLNSGTFTTTRGCTRKKETL